MKKKGVHSPHHSLPPLGGSLAAGATHRTAKIAAARVKRRRVKRSRLRRCAAVFGRECACRERDGSSRAGRLRQLPSPGGQLPHYPLTPRARPRAVSGPLRSVTHRAEPRPSAYRSRPDMRPDPDRSPRKL